MDRILLILLTCFMSLPAASVENKLNTLGRVTVEAGKKMTILTIRLQDKPGQTSFKLENHGAFYQLKLPETLAPEPGSFIDGAGPFLKKVAVMQPTDTDSTIRIFVDSKAKNFTKATSIEVLDKRILVTTDHNTVFAGGANATVSPALKNPAEALKLGMKKDNFYENLFSASLYLGLLFMALAVTLWVKPYLRKRKSKATHSLKPTELSTLNTLNLSPKQKLSLIQVGDEQLLIGITPESINLITKIEKEKASQLPERLSANTTVKEIRKAPRPKIASTSATPSNFAKTLNQSEATKKREIPKPRVAEKVKDPIDKLMNKGVEEAATKSQITQSKDQHSKDESIDNITKLIREKLSNLPTV